MPYSPDEIQKFDDPKRTAKGEPRASVTYDGTQTLWFNTGTLCNIECVNCYIESSPKNDRLVYLTLNDILPYLDELEAAGEQGIEIGFTGGEPFMAPDMALMMRAALERGHTVLMLTNAMQPMMRPQVQSALADLISEFGDALTFRISLDHYGSKNHDLERGAGAFEKTLEGVRWLNTQGARLDLAGRTMWDETEADARAGYAGLISELGLDLDPADPARLVLFPEMEPEADPPEITTACWSILDKDPSSLMCASQRMVVKRKGAAKPVVTACTLLPYDERFELGETLEDARQDVALNHSYCASFCVLGGGSCSA